MSEALHQVTLELFQKSETIFWLGLTPAFLFALLIIFISGQITGGALETLFKRVIIGMMLMVAFPQISSLFTGLEATLVTHFGGEEGIKTIFDRVTAQIDAMKDESIFSWVKIGQMGLTIISTISFLILTIAKKFIDVLHLTFWNLLHILGPIALLGCLFTGFQSVAKGIFLGLFELSLWKPVWVLLGRLLLAIGFGEPPTDPKQWLDSAIMNFAVAGLMISTPAIVHAFLSGSLGSMGSGLIQTISGGLGSAVMAYPMAKAMRPLQGIRDRVGAQKHKVVDHFIKRPPPSALNTAKNKFKGNTN